MAELPRSSPKERIFSPLERHRMAERRETVKVPPELQEEGVEEVPLSEERFEISESGDLQSIPETKIFIPGATKADVNEGIRWIGERLRRQLKRQKAGV